MSSNEMRSVLLTIADKEYKKIGEDFTFPLMEEYASKFGLDFVNVDKFDPNRMYSWQWMELVYKLLSEYDRLFFVSVDAIIAPNARNVLEFPVGTFYGLDEYEFDDAPLNEGCCKMIWEHAMYDWKDEFPISKNYPTFLYNTGLILVDKSHRPLFAPVSNETDHGMMDMAVVNMRIHKYGMSHKDLRPEIFNASHLWFNEKQRPDFLHVMWEPMSKYNAVKLYMKRMGYDS